jgi:hypothetical protein
MALYVFLNLRHRAGIVAAPRLAEAGNSSY